MQVNSCGRSDVFGSHFQPPRLCQRYSNPHFNSRYVRHSGLVFKLLAMFAITMFWAVSGSTATAQKVLTTDAGVVFEGDVFTVGELSPVSTTYEPYTRNSQIAVIDDGYRRVFLNPDHIILGLGTSDRLAAEIEFDIPQRVFSGSGKLGLGEFVKATQFNKHGQRLLTVSGKKGQENYVQVITKITPRYVIVQTSVRGNIPPKRWTMHLARGTVPKEVLRNVLLRNIVDATKPEEYFDIALFWQQIGDFELAKDELNLIEAKFPDMADRIAGIKEELLELKALQVLREVDTWMDSGQSELALKLASVFPQEGLAGITQARFRDVAEQKRLTDQDIESKRTKINELLSRYKPTKANETEAIKLFRTELETDLNEFNAPRLDSFLRLAEDASMQDNNKVSLAISGWVVGSNQAIENFATTNSMFSVRSLVREYLTRNTPKARRVEILEQIGKLESNAPKFIDAMIKQMLPIDPPDLATYDRDKPIEFEVSIKHPKSPDPIKYKCLAHLPPQYDPYRNYPLLLTLPGGNQTTEQHLNMWCGPYQPNLKVRAGHAMRNGYIVVAVQWNDPGQSRWKYSAREHGIVNKALRAAMRKFSIDSDRVFLSGHGIGADGAYDIGLSHPEHWAGVLGFSGGFAKYLDIYKSNKHVQLPIYCVNGSKQYGAIGASQDAQNKWLKNKGYPDLTAVHYLGRANELFMEEIPEAFKWMRPQKRRWPDTSGFKYECSSLRPWDTYFWFYEMYGMPENNVVRPELYEISKNFKNKIVFKGELKPPNPNLPNGNAIFRIEPKNMTAIPNPSTLWLSPEYVNFALNVEIQGRGKFEGGINASREVLLNDVRRRADREHPFWGRIDHNGKKWEANPPDQ